MQDYNYNNFFAFDCSDEIIIHIIFQHKLNMKFYKLINYWRTNMVIVMVVALI